MRYLIPTLSGLLLVSRALAHHARVAVRRRSQRVRRYAREVRPALPSRPGPVPLVASLTTSGVPAPCLSPRPWSPSGVDRSRLGLAVLMDISTDRQAVFA